jgi:hypothetical protein
VALGEVEVLASVEVEVPALLEAAAQALVPAREPADC